tara:strand:+ start:196507 stop:196911 length:405 start_codon:yes stop_codon:yes gene_type:complete
LEQLQLDRLVEQLDGAFGEELPFSSSDLSVAQVETLTQVFGDHGYQGYLQDQVNRQIIRDFLVNAVMLGFLTENCMAGISGQMATREGRAALSLHMLMSSVEQAAELVASKDSGRLEQLSPVVKRPSYIKLIQS